MVDLGDDLLCNVVFLGDEAMAPGVGVTKLISFVPLFSDFFQQCHNTR